MTSARIITLTLGIFAGLIFGALNFWLLARLIRGFVAEKRVRKGRMTALFAAKMAVFLLTIGLILKGGYVSPLPFLAGFTVSLVTGIFFLTVYKRSEIQ